MHVLGRHNHLPTITAHLILGIQSVGSLHLLLKTFPTGRPSRETQWSLSYSHHPASSIKSFPTGPCCQLYNAQDAAAAAASSQFVSKSNDQCCIHGYSLLQQMWLLYSYCMSFHRLQLLPTLRDRDAINNQKWLSRHFFVGDLSPILHIRGQKIISLHELCIGSWSRQWGTEIRWQCPQL